MILKGISNYFLLFSVASIYDFKASALNCEMWEREMYGN